MSRRATPVAAVPGRPVRLLAAADDIAHDGRMSIGSGGDRQGRPTPMVEKAAHSITEREWFSPENYLWLISAAEKLPIARRAAGRRKFRLLACAYCRRIWHLIQD